MSDPRLFNDPLYHDLTTHLINRVDQVLTDVVSLAPPVRDARAAAGLLQVITGPAVVIAAATLTTLRATRQVPPSWGSTHALLFIVALAEGQDRQVGELVRRAEQLHTLMSGSPP
jgi:hypothetical protein